MKTNCRLTALICLLAACLPLWAMAEDAQVLPEIILEQHEPEAPSSEMEIPQEDKLPEPFGDEEFPPSEPSPASDAPETFDEPEVEADYSRGVASGSNYDSGYAKLIRPAAGYSGASPDAEATLYLENGIFYVSDRRSSSGGDRLRVHFSAGSETRSVWVDSRCLQAMNANEVAEFVSSRMNAGGVRCYGGDPMLPLDAPDYSSVVTYSAAQREREAVPAMFVSQTELELRVGETLSIGVSFSDGVKHAVFIACADVTVAAVSADGSVTGVAPGCTQVMLKSQFGNVAAVEIRVLE